MSVCMCKYIYIQRIYGTESIEDFLKKLGTNEKTLGVFWAYEYFKPLST